MRADTRLQRFPLPLIFHSLKLDVNVDFGRYTISIEFKHCEAHTAKSR